MLTPHSSASPFSAETYDSWRKDMLSECLQTISLECLNPRHRQECYGELPHPSSSLIMLIWRNSSVASLLGPISSCSGLKRPVSHLRQVQFRTICRTLENIRDNPMAAAIEQQDQDLNNPQSQGLFMKQRLLFPCTQSNHRMVDPEMVCPVQRLSKLQYEARLAVSWISWKAIRVRGVSSS